MKLSSAATAGSSIVALLSNVGSQAMNDNIFTVLNVLQEVEILALVDLNYPTKLDQFFLGFKFASLHPPESADLTA